MSVEEIIVASLYSTDLDPVSIQRYQQFVHKLATFSLGKILAVAAITLINIQHLTTRNNISLTVTSAA